MQLVDDREADEGPFGVLSERGTDDLTRCAVLCCPQFWAAYVPCDSQWMDAVPMI